MADAKKISEFPAATTVVGTDLIPIVSGGVNQKATADQVKTFVGTASTTAAITYYVDPAGSDSTGDGSVGLPFATVQHALDLIPKRVRHLVNIKAAAGNYAGFAVHSFDFDPLPSTPCGVSILGTLVNSTLVTGSATGTLSSTTAGTSSPVSWAVATDGSQGWTTNNLKARFVNILTGTGAGTILPIESNTGTTLTPVSASTFGGVGSTYAIQDCGSIITTPVNIPGGLPAAQGTPVLSTLNPAIAIYGNHGTSNAQLIRIEGFKTATSGFYGILVEGNTQNVIVARCQVTGSITGSGVSMIGPGRNTLSQSITNLTSGFNVSVAFGSGAAFSSMLSCLLTCPTSGNSALAAGAPSAGASGVNISNCKIDSHIVGILSSGNTVFALTAVRISGGGNQCIKADVPHNAQAPQTFLIGSGVDLSNGSVGIQLGGPLAFLTTTQSGTSGILTGTGNATGIELEQGASIQLATTSTITGTTEVLLDGISTTLAVMRSQVPKLLTTSYGTKLYE